MRLFSVFDPVSFWGFSLNWVVFFFVILLISLIMSVIGGGEIEVMENVVIGLFILLKDISFPKYVGVSAIGVFIFIRLSGLNVIGLFPFIFSVTRHLMVSFGLGMVMWLSFFFIGWVRRIRFISAHLVPEGSPIGLAPFMVFVELIRHLIRPITLSVRLVANMVAGHLILGLISFLRMRRITGFFVSVFLQRIIIVMEWVVIFTQAFVFGILLVLYVMDYR